MTKHNAKADAIRTQTTSLRSALDERRRHLEDLLVGCEAGTYERWFIRKQLSETEDLIQELDRAIDGVPYGEQ